MTGLLVWGAGGHAKVVLNCALEMRAFNKIAFIDDDPAHGTVFCGYPVLGTAARLSQVFALGFRNFVVAIGDNRVRARCFAQAIEAGLAPAIVVHPGAIVAQDVAVGSGTVVMARAVINPGAVIGEDCIINTGAIVEHDCQVGDHAHVSPGALMGGGVRAGGFAQIGIGAVVLPGLEIGEGALAGAGAVVRRPVPPGITVAGVPAKPIQ